MLRLLFEKKGNAVYISHLDLMRLFQRAFKRAGLLLKHTQGYNPRPSVSIALPLSVGVESNCELLDFEIENTEEISCEQIKESLNNSLIAGVRVLDIYDNGRKYRELAYLRCKLILEYDSGIPSGGETAIEELFSRKELILPKKTKNGIQDQDIIPMIQSMKISTAGEDRLEIDCVICCQNPTLNPAQITLAIETHLPEYVPSFCKCCRMEIFDQNNQLFR